MTAGRVVVCAAALVDLGCMPVIWWTRTELGWLLGPGWMALLWAVCGLVAMVALVVLFPGRRGERRQASSSETERWPAGYGQQQW